MLMSKKTTSGSAPSRLAIGVVSNAAIHMKTPVITGYSSGWPPGGVWT